MVVVIVEDAFWNEFVDLRWYRVSMGPRRSGFHRNSSKDHETAVSDRMMQGRRFQQLACPVMVSDRMVVLLAAAAVPQPM